ncbi:MAG: hypothetical protein ACPG6V_05630 [Flavobacteriales bacterium]
MKKTNYFIGLLAAVIVSCVGEPYSSTRYVLDNETSENIQIIRFHKFDNNDTIVINNNDAIVEYSANDGGIGGSSQHEYHFTYDSIQVIYQDTLMVTHLPVNNKSERSLFINVSDNWITKQRALENNGTETTYIYKFTNTDVEEAKIIGVNIK